MGAISASSVASAQDAAFPFPSTNISSGQTTGVLTSHELRADYQRWREQLIQRCPAPNNDARMRYPESGDDTRSEGVGYGMVISAYMGDKETFDGLWNYYQRTSAGTGLMNWRRIDCGGGGGNLDTGSASDADVDAALGLIVANRQWPGQGYNNDAAAIVADIRTNLFLPGSACSTLLTAGTQLRSCNCLNPSYLPPGYYPAFAGNDAQGQAAFWTNAVNGTYGYFNAIRTMNGNTNLVPAWSSSNGSLGLDCSPQVAGGGAANQFQADAARTPWRVATDYQWTGSANANAFLQRIVAFAKTQRVVQIVSLYSLAGQPLNGTGQGATLNAEGTRSSFTMGGLAAAMTASTTPEDLDVFTGAWQSMYRDGDELGDGGAPLYRAFNNSLALLYGLTVTGNMWNPMGLNPSPNTDLPLGAQPGNLLVNGDFDEGLLGWKFQNLTGMGTILRAEGYAMHRDGEMNIVVTRAANPPTFTYQVRLAQAVSVQANQKYLISVRARAATERPFSIGIENQAGGGNIASLGNRRADAPLTIGPDMLTYDWVFTSTASGPMNFNIDVANSDVTVVIDDVVFAPTNLPETSTGDLEGVVPDPTAPGNPPPANPATPGTPAGTGTGTPGTPAGNGTIGTVTPGGDNTGTPGAAPGNPNPIDSTAGMPAAPGVAPASNTCSATNPAVCGVGFSCSVELGLCYDPNTGYVRDPSTNDWALPPTGYPGCSPGQVFWPKFPPGLCYVPDTGYIWNPQENEWQFYGVDYTQGKERAAEDSGCDMSGVPGERHGSSWMLVGLLGAALGWSYRRRAA
jgi:endoglucanase